MKAQLNKAPLEIMSIIEIMMTPSKLSAISLGIFVGSSVWKPHLASNARANTIATTK